MAILFNSSLSNGIDFTPGPLPLTAYPFTFSIWMKVASIPGALMTLASYSQVSTNNYIILYLQNTGAVGININNVASNQAAQTAATVSTNVWHHVCGTATSGAMTIFLDGGNKVSNATVPTFPGSMTFLSAAVLHAPAGPTYFNGQLAEMVTWQGVLSDAQILGLARGAPPNSIVPPGAGSIKIIHYWPMWTNTNPCADISGGVRNSTAFVTAGLTNHPPVGNYARWPNVMSDFEAHIPVLSGQRHHRLGRSWFS